MKDMSEFDVRRARLGDRHSISSLLKVSWHTTYDPMIGARPAQHVYAVSFVTVNLILLPGHSSYVVAHGEVVVGYALVANFGNAAVWLGMLYVHPEWQGQGVGTALLLKVIAEFKRAKRIQVEVLQNNLKAIKFYQRRGFEKCGESKNVPGLIGVSSIYMQKQINAPAEKLPPQFAQ